MTLAPPVSAGRDLALPAIGFGTYGLNGLPALDVIHRAMEAGGGFGKIVLKVNV